MAKDNAGPVSLIDDSNMKLPSGNSGNACFSSVSRDLDVAMKISSNLKFSDKISSECCNEVLPLKIGLICLGESFLESGQSLLPVPPANMIAFMEYYIPK